MAWKKVDTIDDDDYRRIRHLLDLDDIGDMTDEELQDAREGLDTKFTNKFPAAGAKFQQNVLTHFLEGIAAQQDINEKERLAELKEELERKTEQAEVAQLAEAAEAHVAMRRRVSWESFKEFVRTSGQTVTIEMTPTRAYVLRPYRRGVKAVVYKIRGTVKLKNPELTVKKRWEKVGYEA